MNKSIALLIIGVISLAMFLIMINQFATTSNPPPLVGVQSPLPQTGIPSSAALSPPNAPPLNPSQISGQKSSATGSPSGLTTPASPSTQSPLAPPALQTYSPTAPDKTETKTRPAQELASSNPSPSVKSSPQTMVKESAPQTAPSSQTTLSPPAPPKAVPVKPAAPKAIEKISVSAAGDGATVRINGNTALAYKTMHLKDPDRLVVDLEGTWAIKAPGVPPNKAVKNVRIGKQGSKTRIVIDLSRTPAGVNFIKVDADTLEVRVK